MLKINNFELKIYTDSEDPDEYAVQLKSKNEKKNK